MWHVGLIDHSGMRIKMISKLRRYDAAIMELGLEYTDKMAIPPGVLGFPLSGYCIAECTQTVIYIGSFLSFLLLLLLLLVNVHLFSRFMDDAITANDFNYLSCVCVFGS